MIATPSELQGHPSIIGSPIAKNFSKQQKALLAERTFDDEKNESSTSENIYEGEDLARVGYLPTPNDIASACAAIRSEWSLSEKRRRYVGEFMPDEPNSIWSPPVIDTTHFRQAAVQGNADSSF